VTEVTSRTTKVPVSMIVAVRTFSSCFLKDWSAATTCSDKEFHRRLYKMSQSAKHLCQWHDDISPGEINRSVHCNCTDVAYVASSLHMACTLENVCTPFWSNHGVFVCVGKTENISDLPEGSRTGSEHLHCSVLHRKPFLFSSGQLLAERVE